MLHITDHAIIRYIERVMGINIQDIEDKILSKKDRTDYEDYEGMLTVSGVSLVIKNKTIITCGDETMSTKSVHDETNGDNKNNLIVHGIEGKIPKYVNRTNRKKTRKPRHRR